MEQNIEFKIIGNLGELNLSQRDMDSLQVDIRCLSDSKYELFITFLGTYRMILGKFTLNPFSSGVGNKDIDQSSLSDSSAFKVSLWKTVHLPFNIRHFAISSQSLWIQGKNFYVDISSYLKPILQEEKSDLHIDEDIMDIDSSNEFNFQEFETYVEIASLKKYKSHSEKFFLNCSVFDGSIIICAKDEISMMWQLDLIIPSHNLPSDAEHSKLLHLVNFPVTYNETLLSGDLSIAGKQKNASKPVIHFAFGDKAINVLHINFLKKLLGTFPSSSSNCICFIGHPDGKLLYCLSTVFFKEENIQMDSQLEIIYDMRQPIKGINILTEINGIKGSGCLLIVGELGKLVYITEEKVFHNSDVIKIKNASLYVRTLYLPSSVETYILLRQNIFFISNKCELWVSEFSNEKESLTLSRNTVALRGIKKMNELQGPFLFVTRSGHLYLSKYCEQRTSSNPTASLPSLMNMIMHQSSVLHNLSLLSKKQQDFFASLSKFASFKLHGVQKLEVVCSITEVDEPPKKYVINIKINCTEKFDPRFWFATVSLYSYYQKDSMVISKTLPLEIDQKITIEVQESLLCPLHTSAFPLYLETGLLLTLPESFESEECFKLIAEALPLYIKIETLILNELYLLKSKTDLPQNKNQHDQPNLKNAVVEICARNLKKPIAHALHINSKILTNYPQDFSVCLFPANLQQIVKGTSVEHLTLNEILQSLRRRNDLLNIPEINSLTYKNQTSFHVSELIDATYITLRSKSFFLLVGVRMAIMELLLNIQSKSTSSSSKCVSISAIINKECEKLNKELLSMYGQDVETEGFMEKIVSMYCQLRKISRQLPFS